VNFTDYAAVLGVRPQRITKLMKAGQIVLSGDGDIDVDASDRLIAASIDWNLAASRGGKIAKSLKARGVVPADKPNGGARYDLGTLARARIARERATADLAALKLAEQLKLVMPVADVEREVSAMLRGIKDAMLGMPDRLAAVLAAETDEARIHLLLSRELRSAMNASADRAAVDDGADAADPEADRVRTPADPVAARKHAAAGSGVDGIAVG
jgi:phage terminase Nu1 subunit (DNA packaging protein)